jgi:hypothetical protein
VPCRKPSKRVRWRKHDDAARIWLHCHLSLPHRIEPERPLWLKSLIPLHLSKSPLGMPIAMTETSDYVIVHRRRGQTMRSDLSRILHLWTLFAVVTIPLAGQVAPAPALLDDSWENLKHITHRRSYHVVDRDAKCEKGTITQVTDQSLTLKTNESSKIQLRRTNVLRVSEEPKGEAVVFSGISSWVEVKALHTKAKVRIVTNKGDQHIGTLVTANDDSISILQSEKATEFAKNSLVRLYIIREKPLSDSAEFASHEMLWPLFVPELWPYILKAAPTISVRIYDSSIPEQDTPIRCARN